MDDDGVELEKTFEELRPYLFSIAYRMLGTVSESEDVVQEAFLRWHRVEGTVDSPKAFLAKVVTRLSIDHLKSARVRRETYVGPWLPEPLVQETEPDIADKVEQLDSVSMAFLVLMETLNPVERAVFILKEVFGYDYAEIARTVERSEDNCRQIAHRAKQHVAARRPRFPASPDRHKEITTLFIEACAMGDLEGLTSLLHDEITLISDGGGKAPAARRPITGARRVARFLLKILSKTPEDASLRIVFANARPAIVLYESDRPTSLLTLDVAGDAISGIHIVANPEKLTMLR